MDENALIQVLSDVVMMGGDRLSDLLAGSEIRALAQAVATSLACEAAERPMAIMPVAAGLDFLNRDASFPLMGLN